MTSASAFQYLEVPVNYAKDLIESRSFFKKVGGGALGLVAVPFEAVCTPLALLIDVVTGIKDAVLLCPGNDFQEVKKVLFKKVIAFPLQEIAFFAVVSAVPVALFFTAGVAYSVASFILWPLTHAVAKKVAEKLSTLFGTSLYDPGHKGARNCYTKQELYTAIVKNVGKQRDASKIVSDTKDIIIAHARKGKIPGLTAEMLDEEMAYEELSSLVVFYLLLCSNRDNEYEIARFLCDSSGKEYGNHQDRHYELMTISKNILLYVSQQKEDLHQRNGIDFCHRMFCKDESIKETQKNIEFSYYLDQKKSSMKFGDFFKEVSAIASESLANQKFYSLLSYS